MNLIKVFTNYSSALVLAAGLCVSCSTVKNRVTAADVAALTGHREPVIPLRAGLVTPADLNDRIAARYGKDGYLTAAETKSIFEQGARQIFKEVVPLASPEVSKTSTNVDIVVSIAPILLDDSFRAFGERVGRAYVTAQWNINSVDGRAVFRTKAMGQGQVKIPFRPVSALKYWKAAFVAAFKDHLDKATAEIVKSSWWKDTSWRTQ